MIGRAAAVAVLLALVVAPFVPMGGMRQYVLHVVIQIFIWSFIGNAWSLMGRFGLVSLGHGAFLGVGAYTTTLLWNFFGLTPWIGVFVAVAAAVALALIVAYPCSRFGIIGHYFGLVTLAVGEVVRLLIIAERDWTGGSLGLTLKTAGAGGSLLAAQSADKRVFYYAALIVWLIGLWVWVRLDRSMARAAMEAIGEDEVAAASVGVHVARFKLAIEKDARAALALARENWNVQREPADLRVLLDSAHAAGDTATIRMVDEWMAANRIADVAFSSAPETTR